MNSIKVGDRVTIGKGSTVWTATGHETDENGFSTVTLTAPSGRTRRVRTAYDLSRLTSA